MVLQISHELEQLVRAAAGAAEVVVDDFDVDRRAQGFEGLVGTIEHFQFKPFDVGFDEVQAVQAVFLHDLINGSDGDCFADDGASGGGRVADETEAETERARFLDRDIQNKRCRLAAQAIGFDGDVFLPLNFTA